MTGIVDAFRNLDVPIRWRQMIGNPMMSEPVIPLVGPLEGWLARGRISHRKYRGKLVRKADPWQFGSEDVYQEHKRHMLHVDVLLEEPQSKFAPISCTIEVVPRSEPPDWEDEADARDAMRAICHNDEAAIKGLRYQGRSRDRYLPAGLMRAELSFELKRALAKRGDWASKHMVQDRTWWQQSLAMDGGAV